MSAGRANYVQKLIELGYPIHSIAEEDYSDLTNNEEGNLLSDRSCFYVSDWKNKSYLRLLWKKADVLDMDAYKDWMNKLYDEWPISGQMLPSGRIKKEECRERFLSQFWQK